MQRLPPAAEPRCRTVAAGEGTGRRRSGGAQSGALFRALSVVALATGFALAAPGAEARRHRVEAPSLATVRVGELPPEGRDVLARIRAGGPFASRRDGIPFGNRERLLPPQPRGYYAEYTVPTPGAADRGARRIVAGRGATGDVRTSNEYYYTADHYQSFRRIVQ